MPGFLQFSRRRTFLFNNTFSGRSGRSIYMRAFYTADTFCNNKSCMMFEIKRAFFRGCTFWRTNYLLYAWSWIRLVQETKSISSVHLPAESEYFCASGTSDMQSRSDTGDVSPLSLRVDFPRVGGVLFLLLILLCLMWKTGAFCLTGEDVNALCLTEEDATGCLLVGLAGRMLATSLADLYSLGDEPDLRPWLPNTNWSASTEKEQNQNDRSLQFICKKHCIWIQGYPVTNSLWLLGWLLLSIPNNGFLPHKIFQ